MKHVTWVPAFNGDKPPFWVDHSPWAVAPEPPENGRAAPVWVQGTPYNVWWKAVHGYDAPQDMGNVNRLDDIRMWGHERNLVRGSDPSKQFVKLAEEMGELAAALSRGKREEAIDAVGDMLVVLTIMAEQLGVDIMHCADAAWHEIKDRKGKMVNGIFVKEEDL